MNDITNAQINAIVESLIKSVVINPKKTLIEVSKTDSFFRE